MAKFSGSLDTNVLLRLLLNDVPDQHKAAAKLLTDARSQFAVADTVIIELVFVLDRYYGLRRPEIAEAIGGLMQLLAINCNRGLFEKALPIFVRHSSLSFEDSCLSVYAELNAAEPLWTFDKKLARHAANTKLVGT